MTSRPDRQGAARPRGRPSHRHHERVGGLEAEGSRGEQDGAGGLSPGKRQVMEKFFTPVHVPAQDKIKLRKHHHRHHQHQDRETHSYTMLDDDDRSAADRHRHHRHSHHPQDDHMHHHHPHHHHHHHHPTEHLHRGEDEMSDHHTSVTLSRASSSSLSSSSSSSSSWSSEASVDDPFSLQRAGRAQYSLSCSSILETRGKLSEGELNEPIVHATVTHGRQGGASPGGHPGLNPGYARLDRRHSRSEEGLALQNQTTGPERGGARRPPPSLEDGQLYKTASLGLSLAFCEEEGPKREVSSGLLPVKGILKNREAQQDIRKARSMEALTPGGGRGKQADHQAQVEAAKKNFVQEKLQFSAFLDEITRQVISPSRLNTLGVNKPKTPSPSAASATAQAAPKTHTQLPPKKHKRVCLEEKATAARPPAAPGKPSDDACSGKASHPEMRLHLNVNHAHPASPPPQHPDRPHPAPGRRDCLSPTEGPVRDQQGCYGRLLTDQRQPKQRSHRPCHSPPPQTHQPGRTHSPPPESESLSSKSDSSRNSRHREASSATSPSSELSDRHHQTTHRGRRKQHRVSPCDTDPIQVLREENADLHQNLVQTIVCIESLEAELQRTREELSHSKENYKRLQDTHPSTQHTSSLLGEETHTAAESITSERKYLIQQITQQTEELENVHKTIASLENINVHSLVKELLEKHFDSGAAEPELLQTAPPIGQSTVSHQPNVQSPAAKAEETPRDWSGGGPWAEEQTAGASLPREQEAAVAAEEGGAAGGHPALDPQDPPPAVADAEAANQAWFRPAAPQTGTSPGQAFGGGGAVERGVSYLSAQRILDEFIHQLRSLEKEGGGEESL